MIKQKDVELLRELRNNSRESLTKLSRRTQIPVSTIFDKLRDYDNGVIIKNTVLVDFRKLGYSIKVQLMMKVAKQKRSLFQNFIMQDPRVNNLYKINNGYDFLFEAIFRDLNDFNTFTESLETFEIKEKKEFFVLDDLKREHFLTEKNKLFDF